ncbi:hypothetical protein PCASD_17138 [Puccinia coronata f. sp. avenae]|uniref:ATPase AAA-type core domain-containing protein n=1 Tax=Puccinia coronata f. sp. avenae TaxID=200324 RepID=A0A2N5SXF0_9BASI|nr:hypothetical protein PCASD_17138 [Puccinia coronata f. sp. avenae]
MRKDVTLYPVHPPDLRDPNIGRNSFNQHHDKSTFTCIQVTSQSTKAPLYFVISLVYKRKGFVAVQVIAGASTDCSFSHCHARNICGQQLQRKAGDALKEFRIDLTAKAKKEKVRRKPFSLVLLDEFERARAGVIDRKTGQVTEANKEAVRQAVKVLFPPVGQLAEKVRRKPFSLVLLDEFERARAGVIDRKTGQVTEANKEAVRQAVKVLFPPVGQLAEKVRRKPFSLVLLDEFERARAGVIDRKTGQVTEANKEAVRQAVKVLFPPGLINWLDDLVVFHSLAEESVLQIVNVRP